jgi:hypothetical protein
MIDQVVARQLGQNPRLAAATSAVEHDQEWNGTGGPWILAG